MTAGSGAEPPAGNFLQNRAAAHVFLIIFLGLASYLGIFGVPFQWDDKHFVIENPIVRDLSYFTEPSRAEGLPYYGAMRSRFVGYLTFALNYRVNGTDAAGYHAVNLAIHIANALLVYYLLLLTFRAFPPESSLKGHARPISLFASLLFVAHPIQTEAVTYIFQRLASLVTLFYLLSLVFYIKWRLRELKGEFKFQISNFKFYLLSLLFAVLAMKTKENAFTLPLAIALYEFMFFKGRPSRRILLLVPFFLTMLIIPISLINMAKPVGEIIGGARAAARGCEEISRGSYLLTQFRVIVGYIRLILLPVNQNVYHEVAPLHSLVEPQAALSLAFLAAIFLFAAYLLIFRDPDLKLISFGIFWFFLTLSVESSVIPIPMLMSEYRLYLPSVGALTALTAGGYLLVKNSLGGKAVNRVSLRFLPLLLPLILSSATYARNGVWASELSLWQDAAKKSSHKAAVFNNLGVAYGAIGRTAKAIEQFKIAVHLMATCPEAHNNLGLAYASMGEAEKAAGHYLKAIGIKPDYAEAHNNLGILYASTGEADKAVEHLEEAAGHMSGHESIHVNLGLAYCAKGMFDRALECYRRALELNPRCFDAHYNAGLIYLGKGRPGEAVQELEAALVVNPGDVQARGFLSLARGEASSPRRE